MDEPFINQYNWCPHKKTLGYRHSRSVLPSTSREARPRKKPNLPTYWTSRLQNCENINFCCLKHPLCGFYYGSPSKLKYLPKKIFYSFFLFKQKKKNFFFLFAVTFLRGHACNMWKFLGQGPNLSHNNDNARSLTIRPPGNFQKVFLR